METDVGKPLPQRNYAPSPPPNLDWQAARHEAEVEAASAESSYQPSGDDYATTSSFPEPEQDSDDSPSDFAQGYDSATGGVKTFVRERIISTLIGFFSPPGTGVGIGAGAGLMQWIFRDDIES